MNDLKHALRQTHRNPGFTAVALLTLGVSLLQVNESAALDNQSPNDAAKANKGLTSPQDWLIGAEAAAMAFLKQNFNESGPGMAVGLLDENGSRVFGAGGLGNGSTGEVDGDTLFEIGSTTKVFTSLLAMDMAQRGEISLDDPAAKYLPDRVRVPSFEGHPILIRHLATQDSGLPWNPPRQDKFFQQFQTRRQSLEALREAVNVYTTEDLYHDFPGMTLPRKPGSQFQYSNVGMALLGRTMELRAGRSYESLVRERICQPLGMNDTRITLDAGDESRLARGHWLDGEPSEHLDFKAMAPAGSLISTANDLLKFLAANIGLTQSRLSPAMEQTQVVQHTGAPRFGRTAIPWVDQGVYSPPGSELLGHGGGGFGCLAFIGFDKVKRRGVVALSNQMALNPSGVGWSLLQGMPLTRQNITGFVREITGLGVGLAADEKTGRIRITTVFSKSPAGQAGLTTGLEILKIDGASLQGKSLQDCLAMMKGSSGTGISLDLHDPERNETRTVELTRQKFLTTSG